MTPERLAECRECRAIVAQLLQVVPAGRCPQHGMVTIHDAQAAHIRDLEAQVREAWEFYERASSIMETVKGGDGPGLLWELVSDMTSVATATPPSPEVGT